MRGTKKIPDKLDRLDKAVIGAIKRLYEGSQGQTDGQLVIDMNEVGSILVKTPNVLKKPPPINSREIDESDWVDDTAGNWKYN